MKTEKTRIAKPQMKILRSVMADMQRRRPNKVTSVDVLEKIFTEWMENRGKK